MRPPTRRTLAASLRHPHQVTRDLRRRQLPTGPSHAVPTRECQSDPPSLLRTLRCSRPRGQPLNRASPLDVLLHVRAPFIMGPRRRGAMVGSWQGRRECPYQEIRARPRTPPGAVQRGPAAQRFIVKGALRALFVVPGERLTNALGEVLCCEARLVAL